MKLHAPRWSHAELLLHWLLVEQRIIYIQVLHTSTPIYIGCNLQTCNSIQSLLSSGATLLFSAFQQNWLCQLWFSSPVTMHADRNHHVLDEFCFKYVACGVVLVHHVPVWWQLRCLQQNVTVEIGLLKSNRQTCQSWSRNLRMYAVLSVICMRACVGEFWH